MKKGVSPGRMHGRLSANCRPSHESQREVSSFSCLVHILDERHREGDGSSGSVLLVAEDLVHKTSRLTYPRHMQSVPADAVLAERYRHDKLIMSCWCCCRRGSWYQFCSPAHHFHPGHGRSRACTAASMVSLQCRHDTYGRLSTTH